MSKFEAINLRKLAPNVNIPSIKSFFNESDSDDDINLNTCDDCGILVKRINEQYCLCPKCGLEKKNELPSECYSNDLATSYSLGPSNSAIKVIGHTKAARAQNNRMMGQTSDYNHIKSKMITMRIQGWVYQIPDGDDSIPNNVIEKVVEIYSSLQQENNLVKRAGGLNSVLAVLLYWTCINFKIPRKAKTIIKISQIEDSQFSAGERVLRELSKKNPNLHPPAGCGETNNYIDQYFEKLDLDEYCQYKEFVSDLIKATSIRRVADKDNSAIPTTKCAGAIYILCMQLNIGISREDIEKNCGISKSTFMRFVALVTKYKNNRYVNHAFERNNIPKLTS